LWISRDSEIPRVLETRIPVSQKHRDIVRKTGISHGQVQPPIAVEVGYRNEYGIVSEGDWPGRAEGSVPIAQQDQETLVVDDG